MNDLLTDVTSALAGSRFATAAIKDHGTTWDGLDLVTVEWAWEDSERAAVTRFLAEALPAAKVRDYVVATRIYRAR